MVSDSPSGNWTDLDGRPKSPEDLKNKFGWLGPDTKKKFDKRVNCITKHMGNYTLEVDIYMSVSGKPVWPFILQKLLVFSVTRRSRSDVRH